MNLEYLEAMYFRSLPNLDKITDKDKIAADVYLNIAYKEVFLAHSWIYRKRYGQLTLSPRYTTGSASVTKYDGTNEAASKTVAFTGASLTTAMIGRFVRFEGGEKWYRIIYLSGSATTWTVYLDSPVTDVSSGGKTFEIWSRYYYVNSDVSEFLDFGRWSNGRLEYNPDLIDRYTDLSKEGDTPSSYDVFGVDPFTDKTDSATVEIAANTNAATVSGLNLLSAGYGIGDIAEIGGVDYYIRRIESDTRSIFFNYFTDAIPAGTVVTFKKNNPLGFEFYNPPDNYDSIPYIYLGRAYDLVHRIKDRILLPSNFIPAIVSRAQYYSMKDANDARYTAMLSIYNSELEGLKSKVQVVKPRYFKFSPKISLQAPGRS